jgi:hypothetical protein
MANVSSSGIGDTPTGYQWGALSNCTRSGATVENKRGKRWATCLIAPTGASPQAAIYLPFGVNGGSPAIPIVVGGQYGIECEVFVETQDGSVLDGSVDIGCRLNIQNAVSGRIVLDDASTVTQTAAAYPASYFQRRVVFPIWQADTASVDLTSSCSCYVLFTLAQAQTYRIGIAAGARIVKLN